MRAALGGRLTAITGGPGTGKTWIVAALLRVVARLADPPLPEVAPYDARIPSRNARMTRFCCGSSSDRGAPSPWAFSVMPTSFPS